MLALTIVDLLYDNAKEAKGILENYHPSFTKDSYLEFMKANSRVELFDSSAL